MSEARMSHEDLEAYIKALADNRDELDAAESDDRWSKGQASGFRLALAFLHNRSDGEYGQSLDEQREAGK